MKKITLGFLVILSANSVLAGPIERSLGNNASAIRTLESLAYSDLNSPALDSFVDGVKQLASNPDLSKLPSVQIGRKSVSLEGLEPLVEMAKKIGENGISSAVNPSVVNVSTSSPPFQTSALSLEGFTQFVSLESALEASPIPDHARSELLQMVRAIREFATSK